MNTSTKKKEREGGKLEGLREAFFVGYVSLLPQLIPFKMLQQEKFWEVEGDAPLMGKNRGFLKPNTDTTKQISERVSKWPSVISNDANKTVSELNIVSVLVSCLISSISLVFFHPITILRVVLINGS